METKLSGFLWSCLLLSLSLALIPGVVRSEEAAECSVDRQGSLTSFTGENVNLTLPCKYSLADFTCGNYRVKVTPGNGPFSDDVPFTPVTMWTKIVDIQTGEFLMVRTSLNRLKKYLKGKVDNVWKHKEGSLSLDVMNYDSTRDVITLTQNGVFEVTFSDAGDVTVRCDAEDFTSRPWPDTLCGDGINTAAIQEGFAELFADDSEATRENYVNFLILSDETVTQSKTCEDLAAKFQVCDAQKKVVTQCDVIFNDASRTQCLRQSATPLEDYYSDCERSVCDDDVSALDEVNNFIDDNCDGVDPVGAVEPVQPSKPVEERVCENKPSSSWILKPCSSNAVCEALVDNAVCHLNTHCLCKPGFYYANDRCCLKTCTQWTEYGTSGDFSKYNRAVFTATTGMLQQKKIINYDLKPCMDDCTSNDNCRTIAVIKNDTGTFCTLYDILPDDPSGTFSTNGGISEKVLQRRCQVPDVD